MYLYICAQEETEQVSNSTGSVRPTLIIDAGHGGLDGGTVSSWGEPESDINLDIALGLQELCALYASPHMMTRISADIDYPPSAETIRAKKAYDTKQRLELINSVQDGLLLSIHQNHYHDPSPRGAQALYGSGDKSAAFGELLQSNLLSLWGENRRSAARISETIYLMREANCPAVLLECGFLSNPEDANLLITDSYRIKIAAVLMASYLQFTADGSIA